MGELISSHKSESAAMKKAEKKIDFKFTEREEKKNEICVWLDDKKHMPVGIIVHKLKGT
jgi:hypothetical protein